jgi:hypothetical protein
MLRCAALAGLLLMQVIGCGPPPEPVRIPPYPSTWTWDPFLDTLQARTLRYFLDTTPRETGLSPDRWPTPAPSSIAAVGFALTCYPIAAERGMIGREEAAERTIATLRFLLALPQSTDATNTAGYKGFFYHFIDAQTGRRAWNCELSTIDTGLLMAGVLFSQAYFDRDAPAEAGIRAAADSLYRRVEWAWFVGGQGGLRTAWFPDRGFVGDTWTGYDEAMILYILALGSPTHPVPDWYWSHWTGEYVWGEYFGTEFVSFGPLFGHQYSHCWIDYRGIRDRYMWGRGIDYFENSRRATYTHQAYGRSNPQGYRHYSDEIWGWTACDGPRDTVFRVDGRMRRFWSYRARGVSMDWVEDDGTIAPTAAGGSVAFAPEICAPVLRAMRTRYAGTLWREYGFADAFNPTYVTPATGPSGWVGPDYLGIDQGPIAIMIENLRSGFVWTTMKKSPYLVAGLSRAGFSGGWLDTLHTSAR